MAKIYFNIASFNNYTTEKSLLGPTTDFEDNVQLHSAAQVDCEVFLTRDKKLQNMKFFGKTKIAETI